MKKTYPILIVFIFLLGGILFFWRDFSKLSSTISLQLPKIEKNITEELSQLKIDQQIFNPPPLRATQEEAQSFLTRAGVINFTNIEREKNSLPLLKENIKLDSSAEIKAKDMLEQQYFAHESPSGIGVANLAKTVDYNFIVIGENLALGNFKDDQALVQAWMDSLGHRENILNPKYQEMGVSVIKGIYEGKTTWLAVQHFGLSLSACPDVNQVLKTEIDSNQVKLQEMLKQIIVLENELKNENRPKVKENRQNEINEYKTLIEQYNNLLNENQILIDRYNQQVLLFNNCLSGFK